MYWSALNGFANYNKLEAIEMLRGKRTPPNEKMLIGLEAHKAIEDNQLDLIGIGEGGSYEEVFEVPIYDWLYLKGVVDRHKDNVIVDYKTGKGDPLQLYVYAFCLGLKDIHIDTGYLAYIDYDRKTGEVTLKRKRKYKIGQEELNQAWNFIDETSHEIKTWLDREELNCNW